MGFRTERACGRRASVLSGVLLIGWFAAALCARPAHAQPPPLRVAIVGLEHGWSARSFVPVELLV